MQKCKWFVYNNLVRKRSWSKRDEPPQTKSKPKLHQKKIMVFVWWNWKGVVFFELLPSNQRINSDVYCRHTEKSLVNSLSQHVELMR